MIEVILLHNRSYNTLFQLETIKYLHLRIHFPLNFAIKTVLIQPIRPFCVRL